MAEIAKWLEVQVSRIPRFGKFDEASLLEKRGNLTEDPDGLEARIRPFCFSEFSFADWAVAFPGGPEEAFLNQHQEIKDYYLRFFATNDLKLGLSTCGSWKEVAAYLHQNEVLVIVCLHGWSATGDVFSTVVGEGGMTFIQRLMAERGWKNTVLLVPDGNGFGRSRFQDGFSQEAVSPEAYGRRSLDVVKTLGLVPKKEELEKGNPQIKLGVIGHSMGGAAALVFAELAHQDDIEAKAVGLAPAWFSEKTTGELMKELKEVGRQFVYGILLNRLILLSSKLRMEKVVIKLTPLLTQSLGGPIGGKHQSLVADQVSQIHRNEVAFGIGRASAGYKARLLAAAMETMRKGFSLEISRPKNHLVILAEKDRLVSESLARESLRINQINVLQADEGHYFFLGDQIDNTAIEAIKFLTS